MGTTGSGEASGDFSYDMAHEDLPASGDTPAPSTPEQPSVPETSDTSGDLSYDLAHEIPGSDA